MKGFGIMNGLVNGFDKSERGRSFKITFLLENLADVDVVSIIESGLNHRSIKKWFLVNIPMIAENDKHIAGTPCIELFIKCGSNISIDTVVKWFKFGNVRKITGLDSFIREIYYVMSVPSYYRDKVLINDDFYKYGAGTDSNFDWIKELSEYEAKELKKSVKNQNMSNISKIERVKFEIACKGKTLKECLNDDSELYFNARSVLEGLRLSYLASDSKDKPLNYYIYGKKGIGSELYAKILARSLYPNLSDKDLIFSINSNSNKGFLGYDGQPAVIYNGFDNAKHLVDVVYNSSYDSFLAGFSLGVGVTGNVNIIISDVPFETFFNDYSLKQSDIFNYFPLTNVVVLDEDEFLKKVDYRKKILNKSSKTSTALNLFSS